MGGRGASSASSKGNSGSFGTAAETSALNEIKELITIALSRSQEPRLDPNTITVGQDLDSSLIDSNMFYKNIPQNKWFIKGNEASVIGVTEKAVRLDWDTDYGHVRSWFPKSAIGKAEPVSKGLIFNEALKLYGKQLGVKGISLDRRMKTASIQNKIEKAGFKLPTWKDLGL